MSTREPLEALREALARVELMASGDPQWDLSNNDRRALKITLQALAASAEQASTPARLMVDEKVLIEGTIRGVYDDKVSVYLPFYYGTDPAWFKREALLAAQPAPQSGVEKLRAIVEKLIDDAEPSYSRGGGEVEPFNLYSKASIMRELARITPKEKP